MKAGKGGNRYLISPNKYYERNMKTQQPYATLNRYIQKQTIKVGVKNMERVRLQDIRCTVVVLGFDILIWPFSYGLRWLSDRFIVGASAAIWPSVVILMAVWLYFTWLVVGVLSASCF